VGVIGLVLCASLWVRVKQDQRMERLPGQIVQTGWFSVDADGLYHARRVARGLGEGGVASEDPQMNYPYGAKIPWPSYYDFFLLQTARVFLPDSPKKADVEHWVATIPLLFGILTSCLIAGIVFLLSRRPDASLAAGLLHALTYGSVHTSAWGVADHHAFVAFFTTLLWGVASWAWLDSSSQKRMRFTGISSGVIAGILLGSWVPSLLSIGLLQATLLWSLFAERKTESRTFALWFHGVAALTVLPAVISSPWKIDSPWMFVNLSWFHLLYLLGGAFIFWSKKPRRSALIAFSIAVLLWLFRWGPGEGMQEALQWISRGNEFMAGIAESEPLYRADQTGTGGVLRWLGLAVLLTPLAWTAFLRMHRPALRIWLVILPVVILQALLQRRFSDLAVGPIAVVVTLWLTQVLKRRSLAGFAGLVGLTAFISVDWQGPWTQSMRSAATRDALEWVGQEGTTSLTSGTSAHSGLGPWDMGHALEWVAGVGSVGTNFGSYVGEDSYRDAARFYLATEVAQAEKILKERKVRFIFRESRLPLLVKDLAKANGGAPWDSMDRTLLERLAHPETAPAIFQLRYVSPWLDEDVRLPSPIPYCLIWEHTGGFPHHFSGNPGERVHVEMDLELKSSNGVDYAWTWKGSTVVGDLGGAEILLPMDPQFALDLRFP